MKMLCYFKKDGSKSCIGIKFRGLEPIFYTFKKELAWTDAKGGKHFNRYTCERALLDPIRRLIHTISWKIEFQYLKLIGKNPEQCQGCGEGIVRYTIKNPNYPEHVKGKRRWKVCKSCVCFYDMHFSSKEVKFKEVKL